MPQAVPQETIVRLNKLSHLGDGFEVIEQDGVVSIIKDQTRYAIISQITEDPFCDSAEYFFLEERDSLQRVEDGKLKIQFQPLAGGRTRSLKIKATLLRKHRYHDTAIVEYPTILKGLICSEDPVKGIWTIGRPLRHDIFTRNKTSDNEVRSALFSAFADEFWKDHTSPYLEDLPTVIPD